MTFLSKLITAVLAASTLSVSVLAHGEPTTAAAIQAREEHIAKSRRSLANCSEKLRSRDRIAKRLAKRNSFIDSHIKQKRAAGIDSKLSLDKYIKTISVPNRMQSLLTLFISARPPTILSLLKWLASLPQRLLLALTVRSPLFFC
jgi:hypothetical protein